MYQINLKGHINEQNVENNFFFEHVTGTGNATDLALNFETDVLASLLPILVPDCVYTLLQCYNMGDYSDFVNLPLASAGSYASPTREPMFVAVGYTFVLDTRAVKAGSKRFSGIPSDISNEDTITSAEYLALMETLRLALVANVTSGADVWRPIVVKRTKTLVVGTVPPKYRYNLPVPPADATIGHVVQVLTSPALTSQVSRKP